MSDISRCKKRNSVSIQNLELLHTQTQTYAVFVKECFNILFNNLQYTEEKFTQPHLFYFENAQINFEKVQFENSSSSGDSIFRINNSHVRFETMCLHSCKSRASFHRRYLWLGTQKLPYAI